MAFDILTFSDAIKNLLDENNTSTSSYDISLSLTAKVAGVTVGYHKDKPMPLTNYPCVWVEPKREENEFNTTGRYALRDITLDYDIVAITQMGPGYEDGRERADREMLKLSANLEKMFRNYPRLSTTSQVMSSKITNVEYGSIDYNETYNSMAKLNLEVKIHSD